MRHKDANWTVDETPTIEGASLTVLMDIRDELKAIRRLGECWRVSRALDAIDRLDRLGVKRRVVRKRVKRK